MKLFVNLMSNILIYKVTKRKKNKKGVNYKTINDRT